MIKSIKNITTIIESGQKAVSKTGEVAQNAAQEVEKLSSVDGELLKAYNGIGAKKLFSNFSEFTETVKAKLETFKGVVPDALHKKLETSVEANNFYFPKVVAEHYSGLNSCKKLDDAKKLYPEFSAINLDFEKEIADVFKGVVSKNACDDVSKLANDLEKQNFMNAYFEKNISQQVQGWDIYPEFKEIQKSVVKEIIDGDFVGKANPTSGSMPFQHKMPLKYRLMHTPDREQAVLSMLKDHFIHGKDVTKICVKSVDGKDIYAYRLAHTISMNFMGRSFGAFVRSTESQAKQFGALSSLSKHDINSAVMTETWRSSRLRVDLGNETAYGKDWSNVKAVWQKTMFPETTYYPTDKLIDVYLLNMYKSGKLQAENPNPILKYTEVSQMDKVKMKLIKRLYHTSKYLADEKATLNSPRYLKFKKQFDVEGMKKTIEGLEEHYKNAFFKRFWTDDRRARFATALNENRELAGRNIEISDNLLQDAMNSALER